MNLTFQVVLILILKINVFKVLICFPIGRILGEQIFFYLINVTSLMA